MISQMIIGMVFSFHGFRFEVLGRKGAMEVPVPMRVLENPKFLMDFLDEKIDEFIVKNAMENLPPVKS